MMDDALGPVDPDERVEVSVMVKPRRPMGELEARLDRPMTREEFAASYGADPADLARVEDFARQHGLEVVESSQPRRTVRLAGRTADIGAAFGVELRRFRRPDGFEYRAPSGAVQLPAELQDVVQGVFGLDTRPVAHPTDVGGLT
jgi:kumamolisin